MSVATPTPGRTLGGASTVAGDPASASAGLLALVRRAKRKNIQPMEDYGWFGPESVVWRVWSYPSSMTVGFSRGVVVEMLDPFLLAPVTSSDKVYSQARVRYDRTIRYFATKVFADSRKVVKASEVLMRVHAHVGSPDPVSGLWSDPNNPDQQLWIHMTGWHSVLCAYKIYGPELSEQDERRYWAECATAVAAQTIDPDKVPRTPEAVEEYFERMRPRLAASEATQRAMRQMMDAEVILPPLPLVLKPGMWVLGKLWRMAVIATLPVWQRNLANIRQPRLLDMLVRPIMRGFFRAVDTSRRLELLLLSILSPGSVPIAGPMLLCLKPLREELVPPAESFARHGVPTPAELYAEFKRDQTTIIYSPSAPV